MHFNTIALSDPVCLWDEAALMFAVYLSPFQGSPSLLCFTLSFASFYTFHLGFASNPFFILMLKSFFYLLFQLCM